MKIKTINNDKLYKKANKIRIKLLLFTDKEIKQSLKKDNNKRYIKQYNIENQNSFKISFKEHFCNISKKIKIISSSNKEKVTNFETSFISFSMSNISKTLTNSSNSSLPTQEQSFKNKISISKLILRKKVVPENLIYLLEKNKKEKINKSIYYCINSISSDYNGNLYGKEDQYKYHKYLEDLCNNFKNSFI